MTHLSREVVPLTRPSPDPINAILYSYFTLNVLSPKNTSNGLLLTYDDKIVLLSEILELRRALLRISNFLVVLPHQLYNIRREYGFRYKKNSL